MQVSSTFDTAEAVDSGSRFVAGRLGKDGSWRDFDTMAGESTEWVSGFVLSCMDCHAGYESVWLTARDGLVSSARPSGGWGYNPAIPADCDSTAWVLRGIMGGRWVPPAIVRHAVAFMIAHQDSATGGFKTFRREREIADVIKARDSGAVSAWCSPHVCVTANVLLALLELGMPPTSVVIEKGLGFMLGARSSDGTWSSYWWNGVTYATYHTTLALVRAGRTGSDHLASMSDAIAELQESDGGWRDGSERTNAFATAFAVLSLLLVPTRRENFDAIRRGVSWLCRHQLEDGSWPAVPILRIPPGTVFDPRQVIDWKPRARGTGSLVEDHGRLFCTAAATMALHRSRHAAAVLFQNGLC